MKPNQGLIVFTQNLKIYKEGNADFATIKKNNKLQKEREISPSESFTLTESDCTTPRIHFS